MFNVSFTEVMKDSLIRQKFIHNGVSAKIRIIVFS